MKWLPLLFLYSAPLLSCSNESENRKRIENPTSLYFGMDIPYFIEDSLLQNPILKSNEASIIKRENYFIITLKLPHRDSIHLDLYDIRDNDSILIKTISLPEKRFPEPKFSISGKLIGDTISKEELLKTGKIHVLLGDKWLDKYLNFELKSFDLEVQGKMFHSNSNILTPPMIYWIKDSKSSTIRITNDIVFLNTAEKISRVIYGDKTFMLIK